MEVILWMTMALNGIIARENNEEDFISHDSWLSWLSFIRQYGCVIWGRKTYEIVETWDKQYLDDLKGLYSVVVSANTNFKTNPNFELASSPQNAITKLKAKGF